MDKIQIEGNDSSSPRAISKQWEEADRQAEDARTE
jgi:hypothetical protein